MLRYKYSFKHKTRNISIGQADSSIVCKNKSKITLPPIRACMKASSFFLEDHWKVIGTSSSLLKQNYSNITLNKRRPDVVINLKRKLRNPHSYISEDSQFELDYSMIEAKCRNITLKVLEDQS